MSNIPAADDALPIAVIGSGPTGLTLANLLGAFGVRVLLIERNPSTVAQPRAVSIDDESLRVMQSVGVIEALMPDIVPGYGSHYFAPNGRCFAVVQPSGMPYGYPRRNAFHQPVLEAKLRDNLARFATVRTTFGWRLEKFVEGPESVTAVLADGSGAKREERCAYLVGCDGASSTVREQLGIPLEGTTFEERWLIIDLENQENPQKHTSVFCDPRRPCIALPGPHRTRRYEFKFHKDEPDEALLDDQVILDLLARHGASSDATIRRQAVYRFHARVAPAWRRARVCWSWPTGCCRRLCCSRRSAMSSAVHAETRIDPRRYFEQVGAAHHIRDSLRRVVHHDRELIREEAIRALDHEIACLPCEILTVRARQAVFERDVDVIRHDAPCVL